MQENTKQVVVKMTARRAFRTEPIWQYDTGHELVFEGFEGLPATFQVHFSLSPMGQSITQVGQNGVCTLPDMYTRTAAPIYAWLYIAETDTGLTKYSIEIPVQRRAKITNQEPTPVQQDAIDQAIAALNAGAAAAEEAQEAAEAAQASAESYAESAGNSAITATNAATSAAASATSAAGSATAAAASATDANSSREAADVSATNAGVSERAAAASAQAAAGSATAAAGSATQAAQSAGAAAASAQAAAGSATDAAGSAEAAEGSAAAAGIARTGAESAQTAAAGSAQAAAGSATQAAGSATQAAGSATAAAGSATAAAGSAAAAAGSAAEAAQTVAGIEAAGAAQIAAIEDKGEEVLESIPEDYSELSDDVGSLKSALNDIEEDYYGEQTINLYNPDDPDILQNQAINASGEIVSSPNTFELGFIPCTKGDTFTFVSDGAYTATTSRTFVFYDRNKNFISGNSNLKGPTVTIPVECAYFRTLVKVSESSNLMIVKNDSTIHEYVPYGFNDSFKQDTLERLAELETGTQRIDDIEALIGVPQELVFEKTIGGYYIKTQATIDPSNPYSISSSYNGKADFRACNPGDVFVISLRGDTAFRPYAFYDANGSLLELGDNIQYHDERIVAPSGTAYVAFNSANAVDVYGTVIVGEDQFKQIHAEINSKYDAVNARVADVERMLEEGTDVEKTEGEQSGYYRNMAGSTEIEHVSNASFSCSKIEITKSMLSIGCTIKSTSGIASTTIFYGFANEDDVLISKCDVTVGEHQTEIPQNAKYLYLSFFGSTFCDGYVIHPNNVATTKDIKALHISNAYEGLTGVAFGTSLTYRAQTTGGYLQYLPALSGIEFDNQGIGSSTIFGNMLQAVKDYTGYTGKNVALLEGFVNDWYGNKPLGTWKDSDETTVCGCVRVALNYMLSQNANMTVFLILDHIGRNYSSLDCSSTAERNGFTQYEYYSEIEKVANSLGIPVIREYAESQICENTPQYLMDNIHCNALGARQSANFIWSRMKTYLPNAVS